MELKIPLVYKFAIIRKKSEMCPTFWKYFFEIIPRHGVRRVCAPARRG